MDYKIVDNFLPKEEFDALYALVAENKKFAWFSDVEGVAYPGDGAPDKYFRHTFYADYHPNSPNFDTIKPLLARIDAKALLRARANWYKKSSQLIEHGTHVDFYFDHKAFILYLNTNDGFTRMSDGTTVNSIANRGLFFNGGADHSSTNCTDQPCRINIAINYF